MTFGVISKFARQECTHSILFLNTVKLIGSYTVQIGELWQCIGLFDLEYTGLSARSSDAVHLQM